MSQDVVEDFGPNVGGVDDEEDYKPAWEQFPGSVQAALESTIDDVPSQSLALYARWWQFETWLRSLIYVELRSRHGISWTNALPSQALKRQQNDGSHAYMATPDGEAQLAYLDPRPLMELLEDNWDLVGYALIDQDVWPGRLEELLKIRHRIGHCRRPHSDDLARLEQMLRDLEAGAFQAACSFNAQREPSNDLDDPLVEQWVRRQHPSARRLLNHAHSQYDTNFVLQYSKRPWANVREPASAISGQAGYLWHATWFLGRQRLDIGRLWDDIRFPGEKDLLIFVCANDPMSVEVSFACVDDPTLIAEAIGHIFDSVLTTSRPVFTDDDNRRRWPRRNVHNDGRIQIVSPWSIVDETTVLITIFSAG